MFTSFVRVRISINIKDSRSKIASEGAEAMVDNLEVGRVSSRG